MPLKLFVRDRHQSVKLFEQGNEIFAVYPGSYRKGDQIVLLVDKPGWYTVRFEDTMAPAIVYIREKAVFAIPFGIKARIPYNPRAFSGKMHYLEAAPAPEQQVRAARNLALNPYDQSGGTGMYPHARASAVTRDEALFAARNAIDGIRTSRGHYPWPYQSWGIDKNPNAALTIDFGTEVTAEEIVLTLRADYPHDSHWTRADVIFSDGSTETVSLEKTEKPQHFPIAPRGTSEITLAHLVKADDDSPFPALTQIEVWGHTGGSE